jgi:S-adenosyl-L-methionine hydrolase (adenosine-forming)
MMITLLSDFGSKDAYVAVMKGVMAAIAPNVTTCDLTHAVPAQDIVAARFNLMMAYPYFPGGTVHLAVVDPGVGSTRRAIALQCPNGFLVGPDNGLFSGVLLQEPVLAAVALNNTRYWRAEQPSDTFHGRDIFAPAAAYLAQGVPIDQLGDSFDPATLVQLDIAPFAAPFAAAFAQCDRPANSRLGRGSLQYVDHFGNLISNIPQQALPDSPWQVTLATPTGERRFASIRTYSEVPIGAVAALVGSHGWVEIVCNGGSALSTLGQVSQPVGMSVFLETAL